MRKKRKEELERRQKNLMKARAKNNSVLIQKNPQIRVLKALKVDQISKNATQDLFNPKNSFEQLTQ